MIQKYIKVDRPGRDCFLLKYKKEVMKFDSHNLDLITSELQELGVIA